MRSAWIAGWVALGTLVAVGPFAEAWGQEDDTTPRGTRAQPPDVPGQGTQAPPVDEAPPETGDGAAAEQPPAQGFVPQPQQSPQGEAPPDSMAGQPTDGGDGAQAPAEPTGQAQAPPPVEQPLTPSQQGLLPPPPTEAAPPTGDDRGQLAQPGPATGSGPAGAAPPKPVGSPPPPSEEVQAMVAADPELQERTRVARQQIESAELSIAAGQYEEARLALEQANQILADQYTGSRGARLAMSLGEAARSLQLPSGGAVDLVPLAAEIDAVSGLLPGEVVARMKVAARAQRNGKSEEAGAALLDARQTLMSDLALSDLEEAYARSRAAAAELDAANPGLAQSLLHRSTASLAKWQAAAPLVPVRLNLRAAAQAAEERNWARAEVWLNQAAAELRVLQSDAPAAMSRQLAPLAGQLSWMQERLAAGKQPGPKQFRNLAQSAAAVPVG